MVTKRSSEASSVGHYNGCQGFGTVRNARQLPCLRAEHRSNGGSRLMWWLGPDYWNGWKLRRI